MNNRGYSSASVYDNTLNVEDDEDRERGAGLFAQGRRVYAPNNHEGTNSSAAKAEGVQKGWVYKLWALIKVNNYYLENIKSLLEINFQ